MKKNEMLILEAEELIRKQPEGASARIDEIIKELEATDCQEQREAVSAMLHRQFAITEKNLQEIEAEIMRDQMGEVTYKLIPWSYIAKEYFHKSPSWLQQRITGQPIRGKRYTLNQEQRATLSRALGDICDKIGSYRFALT